MISSILRQGLINRSIIARPQGLCAVAFRQIGDNNSMSNSSTSKPEPKKVKFSSFAPSAKEYDLEPDRIASMSLDKLKKFEPKEEFTRVKFDPNVRQNLPMMPNHLMQRMLYGHIP